MSWIKDKPDHGELKSRVTADLQETKIETAPFKMRARSAYLMTSWWVVGIWIGLTLFTGIVSVISVTQPTWYVRYTFVHAQALQEVAFQVVVSSVGPLGFCRVVSVERHPVIDSTSIVEEDEETTPEDGLLPTPATKSPDSTAATESPTGPSQVTITTTGADGNTKSTTGSATLEGFTTEGGGGGDGSFLEWPPTSYTTFGFQDLKMSLEGISSPTAFPGLDLPDFAAEEESDERLDSTGLVISTSTSPFEMYNGAYNGTVTLASDGIREVLFKVTEGYVNVPNKDPEKSFVKGPVAVDDNSLHFPQEEKETEDSGTENSITTERSTTPVEQNAIDTGDFPVRNGGIYYVKENGTEIEEFLLNKQEYDKQVSYRRRKKKKKKKKKKRRDKKKQKKRVRNQTRKEYTNHQEVPSEKKTDIIVTTPMTDLADEKSVVTSRAIHTDEGVLEDEIRAEFLVQQPQNSWEKNAIGLNYKPRRPILACSGVVIGVRSGSSAVWVLVGVVYGVAGVVQVLVGLFSILSQVVKSPSGRYAHAIWMGNVQVAVVMSQGVTLVLFPLGLGSPLARVECGGSSSVYWSGDCSFGWGYMLAIVSTTLAAYCPCLARLTVYKKYALREWESLNFF